MIMSNTQLKKYYFPNKNIENVINKHIDTLIKLYGYETLFEKKDLTYYDRLLLENGLIDKTKDILKKYENIYSDFALTYSIKDIEILTEIIIQSIMAYLKLNKPDYKNKDIFLSSNSVLYFNNLYPANIQHWIYDKKSTILNYVAFMKTIIKLIKKTKKIK